MYSEWAMTHGHMFLRVFCYVGALVMILVMISLVPNRKIPVVSVCGARTLAVYTWHRNVIRIMLYTGLGTLIFEQYKVGLTGAALISLVMTVILSWKYFTYPIDYVLKGMYKK